MTATTGQHLLADAIATLRSAGVPDPARDARRLLAHALDVPPGRLTLVLPDPVDAARISRFDALIAGRAARRPVSHLTGTRQFYGRAFRVTPDVLDPRPETERLVELALERPWQTVLDLGTGSGCILLSLLAGRPGATGMGSDFSEAALEVARTNAAELGLSDRADFRQSDWLEGVTGHFDLVVSNPPYIRAAAMEDLAPEVRLHEPHLALTPGGDGLAAYRSIAAGLAGVLRPGGYLLLEIGWDQAAEVCALLTAAGVESVSVFKDLDGRDRVVEGRMPTV